jgi:hypothetical protein
MKNYLKLIEISHFNIKSKNYKHIRNKVQIYSKIQKNKRTSSYSSSIQTKIISENNYDKCCFCLSKVLIYSS